MTFYIDSYTIQDIRVFRIRNTLCLFISIWIFYIQWTRYRSNVPSVFELRRSSQFKSKKRPQYRLNLRLPVHPPFVPFPKTSRKTLFVFRTSGLQALPVSCKRLGLHELDQEQSTPSNTYVRPSVSIMFSIPLELKTNDFSRISSGSRDNLYHFWWPFTLLLKILRLNPVTSYHSPYKRLGHPPLLNWTHVQFVHYL